jgi:hypothetical protein
MNMPVQCSVTAGRATASNFFYLIILLLIITPGCYDPFEHSKCRMTEAGKSRSPNGEHEVIIYKHFCKPHQNEILETSIEVNETKKGQRETGEIMFIAKGRHAIQATWLDDTNLQIECSDIGAGQISAQLSRWRDVKVSYKLK